jgi:DNA-binding MarR family transcriptional regulator
VTTPRWLDDEEMAFWRDFMTVNLRVLDDISADLRAASDLTMDDYEVLVQLSEAPERRMRMSELSEQVVQSRSRLTQRIDRMVQRGWVRRQPCPEDGRGQFAALTDEGFQVLAAAAPDHVESVRRHLVDRLDRDQLRAAAAVLAELAEPPVG